jgi:hypothetical protein
MIDELHSPSTINYKVNEANTNIGQFVLVYNKSKQLFTLHIRIASDFVSKNNRKSVILSLGFQQSHGCDFFGGAECFYTHFFAVAQRGYGNENWFDREVDYAHAMFKKFTEDFGAICDHVIALYNLVPPRPMRIPAFTYSFEIDPELLKSKVSMPTWIEKVAPEVQIDLKNDILSKIEKLKNEYVSFAALLFQSGSELELSVKKFFEFLGMKVVLAEKSFPVDMFAESDAVRFAIEVTGTNGNINNKDRKVGQAITYCGEKKEDEKVILVANTFRDQPISERSKESFTKEAVKILTPTPFNVCLVTAANLYNFWKDIIEGRKSKTDIINMLRETSGVLEYRT